MAAKRKKSTGTSRGKRSRDAQGARPRGRRSPTRGGSPAGAAVDPYDPSYDEMVAKDEQIEADAEDQEYSPTGIGEVLPEFADSLSLRATAAEATQRSEAQLPDAWYAEYGTAVSRVLVERPRDLPEMVAEAVIGRDDRKRTRNTGEYPFCCICSLIITAANGKRFIGTGWLAGPRAVVTAGHCVYMRRQGGWARHVEVFPGRNGDFRPVRALSDDLRSVRGWVEHARPQSDYGAIVLPESFADGDPSYFGFAGYEADRLGGAFAYIYGYPGDRPPGTMWGHGRRIKRVGRETVVYDIDTYGGNSGGPVYLIENEDGQHQFYVVAIHNYGDLSGNSATRITEAVFNNIKAWKHEP